ncbi:carbohydrate-binding module family 20 domain-containing protein [Solwaraspora sp. WMMD406]|uniref:carbohydrate-binding module family 20 domain-containing protein n=1 Tax=Solwaraspora sp. WMMD406 TaxID=3016095 RepID=UPI002417617A|nr:carbohydrate-binding module family 20 domain-containing protein [Solwaraspora sp. WMMD406]MDG4763559.1 carbohydrate-binding module family 20 domain-containing protein [Solwaraspora sp. WMMD406]
MTVQRSIAAASAALLGLPLSLVLAAPATAAPAPTTPTTVSTAHQPTTTSVTSNGTAIVHLFQWRWESVADECETTLGPNGWGGVQVSPPQEHVVLPSAEGATYPWWQDYQPVSYRIDQTRRGTRAEFVDMVERCRDQGVKIYVDMVLNHMSGTGSVGSGPGSAGTVYGKYDYPDLFADGSGDSYGYADFGPCYRTINNWGSKTEVQDCELLDLADLNTADPEVRRKIAKYMNSVVALGVAGFRVDAAKHVQEAHLADIISRLDDVPGFGGKPDLFHEVYGDGTIPYTAYAPYGAVTNFDYQRSVSSAFRDGSIAQLANLPDYGGLTGAQSVVFIDNHDTQRATPTLTYKDGDRYYLADAFMLAHPYGTPQLMSSYAFGPVVAQGPPSSADGTTDATDCASAAWICEHRDEQVAGMVSFRNATDDTGISGVVTDGNGRLGFARGDRGYAAFNATTTAWSREFSTNLPDGQYCDVARGTYDRDSGTCTGGVVTVSGGTFSASVPANRAVALHVEAVTECTNPAGCGPVDPPPPGDTGFTATVSTSPGQQVRVVGSIPELGSWNPANGVPLSTDATSYPAWTGTADVPAGTAFEWKLVKVATGGAVEWESGANRTGTGGTTVAVVWGQPGSGGDDPPAEAAVSFRIDATTWYGQQVLVVGSSPALGAWDPAGAVALAATEYPVWTGTVSLPAGEAFEYKFIKRAPNGTVTWESGVNRSHTPVGGPVTLTGTWR